ncbi:15897_t:CDS:2 [Rhizophagus irregularis]|nr:15897_t:CDS:2 [Rhizophagus irregularis]
MDLCTMTVILISICGITFITNKSIERDYKVEAKATQYFSLSLGRDRNKNSKAKVSKLSKRSTSETKIIYYEKQLPSRFEEGANVKNSELIIGQNLKLHKYLVTFIPAFTYSAFPKNESDSEDHERKYRQNSPQKKQCTQVSLPRSSDADHDDKIEHSGTHRVGKACDFLCWVIVSIWL